MENQKLHFFSEVNKCSDCKLYKTLEKDIDLLKALFGPIDKYSFKEIEEKFISQLEQHKSSPFYMRYSINLLGYFVSIRPKRLDIVPKLFSCILSTNPERVQEIYYHTKRIFKGTLYNIVLSTFPESIIKFDPQPTPKGIQSVTLYPTGTLFSLLKDDDVEGFIQYLAVTPTFDIQKPIQPLTKASASWELFHKRFIFPLDICCFFGSSQCFQYLLKKGCKPTSQTCHYAIAGGSQEILEILLQEGHNFEDCLETSIQYHRYSISDLLIRKYHCEPVPIAQCLKYFHFESFLFYLINGAFLDQEEEEITPLHSACHIGRLDIVKYLLEERNVFLEPRDKMGLPPIDFACYNDNIEIIKYLIEEHNTMKEYKRDLLPWASDFGYLSLVKYLIEKENVNKETKNWKNETSLHLAAKKNHLEIVIYLIEKENVEKNVKDKNGFTPLHWACKKEISKL